MHEVQRCVPGKKLCDWDSAGCVQIRQSSQLRVTQSVRHASTIDKTAAGLRRPPCSGRPDLFFLPVGLRGLIGLARGLVTDLQRMGHRGPGSQEHPEEVERTESLQSQPLM